MKSWNCIDTKTIYDMIPEVIPTGEYDQLVDQLLTEEHSTGKIGAAYKGNSSYYTLSCMKQIKELEPLQEELVAVKSKIKDLQELRNVPALETQVEILRKQLKEAVVSKELKASIAEVEKKIQFAKTNNVATMIDDLFLQRFDLEKKIETTKEIATMADFLDKETDLFEASLRVILKNYKQNRDVSYLRKGVHMISTMRKQRTHVQEDKIVRMLMIDLIGHVSEFTRLFDLEQTPKHQLLHLYSIYRESQTQERKWDAKFLMDATLYYVNALTERGDYRTPTSTQEATASSGIGISWRSDEEEPAAEEENAAKKNEARDNAVEYKAQREVDYYEGKASRWV